MVHRRAASDTATPQPEAATAATRHNGEAHDASAPDNNVRDDSPMTLDMLLRRAAARAPGRLAFADPPDRSAFGQGPARTARFAEADAIVGSIAARLIESGLRPGERIAIRLPNIIELPLMMIGAWRAGLVPVCLPLLWRAAELDRALPQIDAAAFVTIARLGDHHHSETIREAAARHGAGRPIFGIGGFGIGGAHADGIFGIDHWFSEDAAADPAATPDIAAAAEAPAAMTWATGPRGVFPVSRTHRELIALGRMAASELGLDGGDVVLTPYPMTSIAALAGQMVAALHAGATMALHQPFGYGAFVSQMRTAGATVAAVPDSVLSALIERGDLDGGDTGLRTIARIRPWPHQPSPLPDMKHGAPAVFDIHNIGEYALVIERPPAPAGLPLGKLASSACGQENTAPYLETRVRGSMSGGSRRTLSGTLLLRGPSVPAGPFCDAGAITGEALRPDAQGFLDTGLRCVVHEESPSRFLCAPQPALIYHGGVAIGADELDAAYASFPDVLDAAALPIDDDLMGERIFAAVVPAPDKTPSLTDLRRFLAGKGLAPYKYPERIVVVKSIPRDGAGDVLRAEILNHV